MPQIQIDELGAITLPAEILAKTGLKPNDPIEVDCINGVIVLNPVKPLMEFAGTCKGVWGNSTEEIEATLAEHRASWDR